MVVFVIFHYENDVKPKVWPVILKGSQKTKILKKNQVSTTKNKPQIVILVFFPYKVTWSSRLVILAILLDLERLNQANCILNVIKYYLTVVGYI